MTFSVTNKLENGWKWTAKDSVSALENVSVHRLNSWLTVPKEEYTVKVSSGEGSKMKMCDGNWSTYWQSSSGLKHWMKMAFAERACISGIGVYLNPTKDGSYIPDHFRVTVGVEDGDETQSGCILTHCVQRDFKGMYVMELGQRSSDCNENREGIEDEVDDDTKALKDSVRAHPRGYAQCDWIKIEWVNVEQSRYARIRHIEFYSKQCHEFDPRLRACMVQKRLLLEDAGMRCVDLLDHIEAEQTLLKQREEAASLNKKEEDKVDEDGNE